MIKKIITLLLILSLIVFETSISNACSVTVDLSKYTGTNAAVRSLFMPGWGQGWNEQYTKGWIVFGIFAVSTFGYFYYFNKAEADYKKYENNGSIDSSYYDDYQSHYNTSLTCGIVALVTWAYAVADAYFVGREKSKQYAYQHYNKKFNIMAYNNDGVMLKYRTKFSL